MTKIYIFNSENQVAFYINIYNIEPDMLSNILNEGYFVLFSNDDSREFNIDVNTLII